MCNRTMSTSLILILIAHLVARQVVAAEIDWSTIDCGGGVTASATYSCNGTIGQPDAAATLAGATYSVTGGFWTVATTPPACVGDLNGDRFVDLSDLATLLANFGQQSGAMPQQGDTDADRDVDLADLARLLAVFGSPCP